MGENSSRNRNPSSRTLEQQCEGIPVFLNVEKWKVLTHNVKFRATQNIFICVGSVEDIGIFGKSLGGYVTLWERPHKCT
jgi:hypothetical protein